MEIKLINPKAVKVARVISFIEKFTHKKGTICYLRPQTKTCWMGKLDNFDFKLLDWLKNQPLQNVDFVRNEAIIFEHQMEIYKKIYPGPRVQSKLLLTCHGDYTIEEIEERKQISARLLKLNIFWDTTLKDCVFDIGDFVTFDKKDEKYFFDVIDSLESL